MLCTVITRGLRGNLPPAWHRVTNAFRYCHNGKTRSISNSRLHTEEDPWTPSITRLVEWDTAVQAHTVPAYTNGKGPWEWCYTEYRDNLVRAMLLMLVFSQMKSLSCFKKPHERSHNSLTYFSNFKKDWYGEWYCYYYFPNNYNNTWLKDVSHKVLLFKNFFKEFVFIAKTTCYNILLEAVLFLSRDFEWIR